MSNVLLVFASDLHRDLSERPGRSKLEKQEAAKPRSAMEFLLERLSRDMERHPSTAHLRADLLEEPLHILRTYQPKSLSVLLSNFRSLVRIPKDSSFAQKQPSGYIASFEYPRVGWAVLAAYFELNDQPVLVFLRAQEAGYVADLLEKAVSQSSVFGELYEAALEAAVDAT